MPAITWTRPIMWALFTGFVTLLGKRVKRVDSPHVFAAA